MKNVQLASNSDASSKSKAEGANEPKRFSGGRNKFLFLLKPVLCEKSIRVIGRKAELEHSR